MAPVDALEETVGAWMYRARHPLRGPRASSLRSARALAMGRRAGPEAPLTDDDVSLLHREARGPSRFLGIYSPDGMLAAMEAHGLLAALARHGLSRVGVAFDLADPFEHHLTVYDGDPSRRVGELVASRLKVDRLGPVALPTGSEALSIGWLTIENPDAALPGAALPGQERPGLGLARAVINMALAGASCMGFAAVLAVPAHYHLAWMYHPWFRPLDPRDEGALLALREATAGRSRRDASWAIARHEVALDGAPWTWPAPRMCAPLDASLRAWITSSEYAHAVVEAAARRFACAPPR